MIRSNHETLALERFRTRAQSRQFECFSTQRSANRIRISGNVYYQFGDLRVALPEADVIVEVESAGGGTTNLAKYWECFEQGRTTRPIRLLHLFRQQSPNDYEAHMIVWRFLCSKMQTELGGRFEGMCFTYRSNDASTLDPALDVFDRWLSQGSTHTRAV
jgi:hypothetical protein